MTNIAQVHSTGGEGVPSIYKEVVTTCLDCPRVGVDTVITTDTHLIEFCRGVVVRSCRLGPKKSNVRRIRMLQGDVAGKWFYVLEEVGRVVFIRGKDLIIVKELNGVEEVAIGDVLKIGRRLVKATLTDFEVILTDGETEYDVDQEAAKVHHEVPDTSVNEVLEQRLAMTREAVVKASAELEMTTKFVDESIKKMMLSCEMDELVELKSVKTLVKEDKLDEQKKALVIKGHWLRLLRGQVMIGLELESFVDSGEITDVAMHLVFDNAEVEYRCNLLQTVRRGDSLFIQKISKFVANNHCMKSTVVANVLFSNINSSITNRLEVSVSYSVSQSRRRMHTRTVNISLNPLDFCSPNLSPSFISSMALPSLTSVYLTGVREVVKFSTELGFLMTLPGLLAKLKFTWTETIGGYLFNCPAHPLYLSIIMLNFVNNREVEAIMYAQDYSHLSMLIQLLREVLPADIQFQVSEGRSLDTSV